MAVIYVYDGTWIGLMCLIHRTALDGNVPEEILRYSEASQGRLFQTTLVESDDALAEATASVLRRRLSKRLFLDAWFALLSDEKGVDLALWLTLARVWNRGIAAARDLADPSVHRVHKAARRTGWEYNKFLGVVRFEDVGGVFYAPLEPDCDVLVLLAEHFQARLADQRWILHDLRRGRGALYDGREWRVADMNPAELPSVTPNEKMYRKLWREFYKSTTTTQRLNPKLQRSNMPKKYWKHLVEKPGELQESLSEAD